jgi:hypothetical protein
VMAAREARPRLEYKSSSCASSCFPPLHKTARVSYQKEVWGDDMCFPESFLQNRPERSGMSVAHWLPLSSIQIKTIKTYASDS